MRDLSHFPVPRLPEGLDTPALVIDIDVVQGAIEWMAGAMRERGVALRPHAKTHKSVEIGRRQIAAGASGLTVGTLGEAEVFAAAGLRDLFIAYPLWASETKAARLRALHAEAELIVGVDSEDGARALASAVEGSAKPLKVAVEVDSGGHRTGVADAATALRVAEVARKAGLDVVGVFTHGGHSYTPAPGGRELAARDEVESLTAAATALRGAGFEAPMVSAGSTPSARLSARGAVTEERPGTYVFGDRMQAALGSMDEERVGLVVATTVVSTAVEGHVVVDAGAKTLTKDKADWIEGYGLVPAIPGAVIQRLYDYHAAIEIPANCPRPSVGDTLAIVPNHVCPVVDLADWLIVVREGRIVDRWCVDARGRSS